MYTKIFHSVNSGLYLWDGKTGLLIDGVSRGTACGFSDLPQELEQRLCAPGAELPPIHGILFTHCHPDHFDAGLLEKLKRRCPGMVCMPKHLPEEGRTRILRPGLFQFRVGGAAVMACETTHDSRIFADTPHLSYQIDLGGERFFIAGDARLDGEEAVEFLGGERPAAAFINVYQAMQAEPLAYLRRLAPRRVFLYHLPFPRDDRYQYHTMADQALKHFPRDMPPLERMAQMAWVDSLPADWPGRKT